MLSLSCPGYSFSMRLKNNSVRFISLQDCTFWASRSILILQDVVVSWWVFLSQKGTSGTLGRSWCSAAQVLYTDQLWLENFWVVSSIKIFWKRDGFANLSRAPHSFEGLCCGNKGHPTGNRRIIIIIITVIFLCSVKIWTGSDLPGKRRGISHYPFLNAYRWTWSLLPVPK